MNLSTHEEDYRARINRVMDYIQMHLDRPLRLNELAEVANFSPFHFHRIFRAMVGETLNRFIQRLRVEKAASMLVVSRRKSITEIALDCGFSGSAPFARQFREYFGMSASAWRAGGFRASRKIGQVKSKNGKTDRKNRKDRYVSGGYIGFDTAGAGTRGPVVPIHPHSKRRRSMMNAKNVKVEVRDMPAMTLAYVRHIGPYKGNAKLFQSLWSRLMTWAGPRGLMAQPDLKCISVYHDDPEITDEENLRTSVCITVPPDTAVDGEIGKMNIPAGRYALSHFEISQDQFQQAWDFVCGEWLPKSGYQPADGPCYEWCHNDPSEHPQHKHIIDICVPVKPL
ncbi:AraC family transcriptional regulator [bacterium]|nr:AraC family transcriptional regulator [bacterium]